MERLIEFLQMGGYAAFVWPSYLLAGLILGGMGWVSWHALRQTKRELQHLETTPASQDEGDEA